MSGTAFTYQPPINAISHGFIVRSADGAFIPCDLNNMDYQAFLAWIAAGNTAPEGWTGPTNPASTA